MSTPDPSSAAAASKAQTAAAPAAATSPSPEIVLQELRARRDAHLRENPKARARNAAEAIGMSEAQLVALDLGDGAVRLTSQWSEMLAAVESMGEVMALTRNEACVHEKHGVYRNFEQEEGSPVALFVDEKIDLRIFLRSWAFAFAVTTPAAGGNGEPRRSLQFFNAAGQAVHKIYMTGKSDLDAYHAFVERFTAPEQQALLPEAPPARPAPTETPDEQIDREAFLAEWGALQDTHDFFGFIRKAGVTRTQALRLADGEFTRRVEADAARRVLQLASSTQTPIMVFVGNPGCIQIHTGPVVRLLEHGPWYNVMDPEFNLHLNETAIDQAWVVRKPSVDGDVTSLEVFDAAGEVIVQLFGKRKPGIPELESWREIAAQL